MGEAGLGLVVVVSARGWSRTRGRSWTGLWSWTRSGLWGWSRGFLTLRLRRWAGSFLTLWLGRGTRGFLTLRSWLRARCLLLRSGTRLLLDTLLLFALLLLRLRALRLLLSALRLGLRALLVLDVALLCALLLLGATLRLRVVALLLRLYAALGLRCGACALLFGAALLVLCRVCGTALLLVVALLNLLATLLHLLDVAGCFRDAWCAGGKASGTSVGGLCGASLVGGVELLAVLRGSLANLGLCGDGAHARLAHSG